MIGLNNISLQEVKEHLNTYTDSFYIDKAMLSLAEQGIIQVDQISDCIVALLKEGFIVKSPSSGLKYYTSQTYKLRYLCNKDYDVPDDSTVLDQKTFGTFLDILANAYERSHANLEFLLKGSQHLQLKSVYISYNDLDSYNLKFRAFNNNQILLDTESRYIIGFPVIKYVPLNKDQNKDDSGAGVNLIPVFYFNIKDIETIRGEVNTYKGVVEDLTTPFINNYFLENINSIFPAGAKDTYGSIDIVLKNFISDFKRKISISPDPVTDTLRLFKHYFINYFAYKYDFNFKQLSQIGLHKNSVSEIYNACIIGQIKNTTTSQCAKEIREIASLALQEKMPRSCLDVLYDSGRSSVSYNMRSADPDSKGENNSADNDEINPLVKEYSTVYYCLDDKAGLDEYQVQAVKSFLTNKVTLLQGPPGTGKTYTIATAAMNCMLRGQKCLVTSYNHAAISAFNQKAIFEHKRKAVLFNKELKSKEHSVDLSFSSLIKKGFSDEIVASDEVFNCFSDIRFETDSNKDVHLKEISLYLYIYEELLPTLIRNVNTSLRQADVIISQDPKLKALFDSIKNHILKVNESNISVVDESRILDLNTQELSDLLEKCRRRLRDIRVLKSNIFGFKLLVLNLNKDYLKTDVAAVQKCLDAFKEFVDKCSELIKHLNHLIDNKIVAKDVCQDLNNVHSSLNYLSFRDKSKIKNLDKIAAFLGEEERKHVSSTLEPHLYKIQNGLNPDNLKNEMAEEVFKHFPVVSTSILSVAKSVPLKPEIFDLIVIDESSQFDFISIIPVLFRAKRVAVVGDPKQLEPINSISKKLIGLLLNRVNNKLIKNYANLFNFSASAYDFIENYVVSAKDIRKLRLLYNRRSEPKITAYISKYFYNNALQSAYISRSNISKYLLDADKGMHFIDAPLDAESKVNHIFKNEAVTIIELLRGFFSKKGSYKGSVGVIAPFTDQVSYINKLILKDPVLSGLEAKHLYTSTVHSFQGQERDTIVLSLCLKNNNKFVTDPHLINVAISRARDYLFVVGNKDQAINSHYSYIRALVQASEQNRKNRLSLDEPSIDELIDNKVIETQEEGLLLRSLKVALEKQGFAQRYLLKTQYAVSTLVKTYRVDIALIDKKLLSDKKSSFSPEGVVGLAIECNGAQHYVNNGSDSIDYDITRKDDIRYSPTTPLEIMEFRNSMINANVQSCVDNIIDRYKELIEDD